MYFQNFIPSMLEIGIKINLVKPFVVQSYWCTKKSKSQFNISENFPFIKIDSPETSFATFAKCYTFSLMIKPEIASYKANHLFEVSLKLEQTSRYILKNRKVNYS